LKIEKQVMNKPDSILTFLNAVTPRVGPVNAVNLIKDAHLGAFRELFKELGLSDKKITEVIDRHLQQTAQNVLKTPTPSPIQKL
jgi:hypothetical protein